MWNVISGRLEHCWLYHVAAYVGGWGFATVVAAIALETFDVQQLALLAGVGALMAHIFGQGMLYTQDSREHRDALHFSLPVTRKEMIAARFFEPMLFPLGVLALTASVYTLAGLLLDRPTTGARLLALAILTLITLLADQVHLLLNEMARGGRTQRWRLLSALAFGLSGSVFGYAIAGGAVHASASQEIDLLVGGVLAGIVLLGVLLTVNRRLLLSRDCFVR